MAVQNPPSWLQAGSHPAEGDRRMVRALAAGRPGVVALDDLGGLLVAENTTPDMSVDVAAGACYVEGSEATFQGVYYLENRSTHGLAVAASDPTNARIDLVVAKVEDSAYSGAVDAGSLAIVTGVAAPTPSEPSAPANSEVLARIDVGAGVTSITNADITDRRRLGGHYPVYTGAVTGTTDGAGDLVVSHGAPFTPGVVFVQEEAPAGVSAWTQTRVTAKSATTFTIRCIGTDASVLTNTGVGGKFLVAP